MVKRNCQLPGPCPMSSLIYRFHTPRIECWAVTWIATNFTSRKSRNFLSYFIVNPVAKTSDDRWFRRVIKSHQPFLMICRPPPSYRFPLCNALPLKTLVLRKIIKKVAQKISQMVEFTKTVLLPSKFNLLRDFN